MLCDARQLGNKVIFFVEKHNILWLSTGSGLYVENYKATTCLNELLEFPTEIQLLLVKIK